MKMQSVLPLVAVLAAGSVAAQQFNTFDTSGNANLKGAYFVREVLIGGQDVNGQITSASSAIGTVTFDGQGNYAFTGQGTTNANTSGSATAVTKNGTYSLAANGFFRMASLVSTDTAYGGVSALGPSAFVASATEGTNVDMIVGVPASASATAANVSGAFSLGYIDFLNADATKVREALFNATADGKGSFGNVTVSGKAADAGSTATQQTVSGASYAFASGSGTANFGTASATQLISGTKTFNVSTDGSIVIGGNPNGFDLLVGIKAFSGAAGNGAYSGFYYIAGLEESVLPPASGGNSVDAFYGSINSTGAGGVALIHNRFQSFQQNVFDITLSSQYSVGANGTFTPGDIPYSFTLGNTGNAFVATGTGDATTGALYSLMVGFGGPSFTGSGVRINPLGVVNAASFAPGTNPVAGNEIVTIFGTNLAAGLVQASNLPLPTSLGNVSVNVNGTAAPLFYVSPAQIAFLVPSADTPSNNVFYATIQVNNNGTQSNAVTVYTEDSAPGVISQSSNGIGPAAAQHTNFATITSSSPARAGETVLIYMTGLGAVTNAPPDGSPASGTTLSQVSGPAGLDLGGVQSNVSFAGLTPTTVGLYQMNAVVGPGTTAGTPFVDVATGEAFTSEATLNTTSATAALRAESMSLAQSRPWLRRASRNSKAAGKLGRSVSAE